MLLGVIRISETEGYALLASSQTGTMTRLPVGRAIEGWTLFSVRRHEAEFVSGDRHAVLTLGAQAGGAPEDTPPP